MKAFTEPSRHAISQAQREARAFNHDFVGTEHVLLGIMSAAPSTATDVLRKMNVRIEAVRGEIEKRIGRGAAENTAAELPLTPRAKKALEYAEEEARYADRPRQVGPEHLLLGLLRESEGVAGMVLRALGVKLEEARDEVLKIHLMQMRIVERAVRPVHATTPRRRKMREELLGHLSAIYEEEQARVDDPDAAIAAAARRFGDTAELSRELQAALPLWERVAYHFERRFGWRAPESAARYTLRVAALIFCMIAVLAAAAMFAVWTQVGWGSALFAAIRPLVALLVFVPVDLFVLGWLHFKMRDAMWGPRWAKKSKGQALAFAALIAAVVFVSGAGFVAACTLETGQIAEFAGPSCAAAVGAAVLSMIQARFYGQAEIGDTYWACLEIS